MTPELGIAILAGLSLLIVLGCMIYNDRTAEAERKAEMRRNQFRLAADGRTIIHDLDWYIAADGRLVVDRPATSIPPPETTVDATVDGTGQTL